MACRWRNMLLAALLRSNWSVAVTAVGDGLVPGSVAGGGADASTHAASPAVGMTYTGAEVVAVPVVSG